MPRVFPRRRARQTKQRPTTVGQHPFLDLEAVSVDPFPELGPGTFVIPVVGHAFAGIALEMNAKPCSGLA